MLTEAQFEARLATASQLWLFLDYDGTLAEFSRTPDIVEPKFEVVELLQDLSNNDHIRLAVVSGRPLEVLEELLPISGAILAGTYGVELRNEHGDLIDRLDYSTIRPALEQVKPKWQALVDRSEGLQLEDKRWSLALHARWAGDELAADTIEQARESAEQHIDKQVFHILGGHKFLEVAPLEADKGQTVAFLLARYPWEGSLPLYFGDDDKDEGAFAVVKAHGGLSVLITEQSRPTAADYRIASPHAARASLAKILKHFRDLPA